MKPAVVVRLAGPRVPRLPCLLAALFAAFVALLAASPAYAQRGGNAESQARALQRKAMEEDYLATEFDKADGKLTKAIALCGDNKCSPSLRALLRRDLGVVRIGAGTDRDKGIQSLVDALKIDPNVTLDPDVKTKELEAAFDEARKKAGLGGGGGSSGGGGTATGVPSGDFTHTPPAEQQVRTPVPIYAEYTGSETLGKVLVKYKGFGMPDFKSLELKKTSDGKAYAGEIPCADAQQGQIEYYLQGFNEQNDPVATSGDRNHTYKVPIKAQIDGEPPHNPNEPPPTQCQDTGDCPPGFPCDKKGGAAAGEGEASGKDEGASCEEDSECKSGQCKAGECTAPASKSKHPKVFIGLSVAADFVLLGSAQDVCRLDPKNGGIPLNTAGFYCTNADGTDYPRRDDKGVQNNLLQAGRAGSVNGGVAPGGIHILASLDYAATSNLLLGARLGYVAGKTYPGQAAAQDGKPIFPPIHVEVRATLLFGKEALAQKIAPYILLGAGVSRFDGEVDVPVSETGTPGTKLVQSWQLGGPGFVTAGAGLRFALGEAKRAAIMFAPLKGNLAFGAGPLLPSIQPELGLQLGF